MLAWRYVLLLVLVSAAVGGIAGGLVAGGVNGGPEAERGTVVSLGGPESIPPGREEEPFCKEFHQFCLVKTEAGDFIALYTYDPHPFFRTQGCTVAWLPDFAFRDPETGAEKLGWFRGRCSGSTFDKEGRLIFGPGPRDLDRFPIALVAGVGRSEHFEVDTRRLICGKHVTLDYETPCPRAPRPE